MKQIKIQCPAKINLTLKVLNKREDGFHNIESVMQTINLFDYLTINFEPSEGVEISLDGNSTEIPYNEKNLVYKACRLFMEKTGLKGKISVYIDKNIPVSAGLAGGSTDASGTIFGLNEIFDKPLSRKELHELCAKLGSDLNVCLEGGRLLATGRGEIIEPLEFVEFNVSLIKPIGLGISAKEAYEKFAAKQLGSEAAKLAQNPPIPSNIAPSPQPSPSRGEGACADSFSTLQPFNPSTYKNFLEWAIINDYEELQKIKKLYPKSMMSGSGSTYFIINDEFQPLEGYWVMNGLKAINTGVCVV